MAASIPTSGNRICLLFSASKFQRLLSTRILARILENKVGYFDNITTNIPYSLLFLAAPLIQAFDVSIIDQRVEKNWKERLIF